MEAPLKQTQGNKKIIQHIEDLKRNEIFIKKTEMLFKVVNKQSGSADLKEYQEILDLQDQLNQKTNNFLKFHKQPLVDLLNQVTEKYGLNSELFGTLATHIKIFEGKFETDYWLLADFCTLIDNMEKIEEDSRSNAAILMDYEKTTSARACPVSIGIHKFASKRDVLDFIEKRWPIIEEMLQKYRRNPKPRFRKRKINRKITDFIWENRGQKIEQLKSALDQKFPCNNIVYFEIYKILSEEKKRREFTFTVGH